MDAFEAFQERMGKRKQKCNDLYCFIAPNVSCGQYDDNIILQNIQENSSNENKK